MSVVAHFILNFPKEEGSFGCDFNCPFCIWRDIIINKEVPTNEEIDYFLQFKKIKDMPLIGINGGGDPLFQWEKNKHEIFRICERIKFHNKTPRITTHNLNIKIIEEIYQYCNNKILFKFSVTDNFQKEKLNEIKKIIGSINISQVVFHDDIINKKIEEYLEIYGDIADIITFSADLGDPTFPNSEFSKFINSITFRDGLKINFQPSVLKMNNNRFYYISREIRSEIITNKKYYKTISKFS